ncbi:MAG: RNA methyltransferase [Saprospiraceae bacterium]|nr:RNA methyltransferase [Saprospiraceae bacterium]
MRKLKLHELDRPSLAEYQARDKRPVIVVLDNLRSGLNVGSIFRTADAFAIEKVLLTGITARPPHREIQKTAIGATESVAWEYVEDPVTALRALQEAGYEILPVEQTDQSVSLWEVDVPSKVVLVFGNEVDGVRDEILALAEQSIEIPQYGTKHSFNVAVSAGIVLWEVCRWI